MKSVFHAADSRGAANHVWLNARHSFSFANHYDPNRMHFGVLRVLNDDVVSAGMGFGMHPHDNMEIVTIPLQGRLEHKDSMGNQAVIHTGDVQVMSAGTGVRHSEFNPSPQEMVSLLQIWVFPKVRNVEPRYDQKTFEVADRMNKWQLVVSPDGSEGAMTIHQDAYFSLGNLAAGVELDYEIRRSGNGVYLFVIEGSVVVNGDTTLNKRDALGLWELGSLKLKATEQAEVLLMEVPME